MPQVNCRRGSAAGDVVVGAAIIVFIILPVFSVILEKYLILNKAQIIKDAMDMTNISVYNAMNAKNLGKVDVDIDYDRAEKIYKELLVENLGLDENLVPLKDSLAEDKLQIKSIIFYTGDATEVCPESVVIKRPSVHSTVIVPVRPSLYRSLILSLLGRRFVELEIHVDSEIPVNN